MAHLALSELCRAAEDSGAPLPLPLVVWLSRSLGEAMADLHGAGRTLDGRLTEELVSIGEAGPPALPPPRVASGNAAMASRADVESLARVLVAVWTAGTSDAARHREAAAKGRPDFLVSARPDLPVGIDGVLLSCFAGGQGGRYESAAPLAVRLARLFGEVDEAAARRDLDRVLRAHPESVEPTDTPASPGPSHSLGDDELRAIERPGSRMRADSGGPLGPEASCIAHLADFPGQVKGALVKSVYEALTPSQRREVEGHLVPEYREILAAGLMPSSWYPEIFFAALQRASHRVQPPGSLMDQMVEARRVFDEVARSYHRLFYRVVGPRRLLVMMNKAWGLYHTVGEGIVHDQGDSWLKGAYVGNPAILEPGYAEGVIGSTWAALRLAGAKAVEVEFRREAPDRIEMDVRWRS